MYFHIYLYADFILPLAALLLRFTGSARVTKLNKEDDSAELK